MEYKAFEDGIEVNGTTIMSIVDGMGVFRSPAERILKAVGLGDIVADDLHWYSQQSWLDAFNQIAEKIGEETLRSIGRKVPENAVFPPHIDNAEAALAAIDVAYHMNHRNSKGEILFNPTRTPPMLEGIGHYQYEARGNGEAKLLCENPYPCAFDQGIISAMAKRFAVVVDIEHLGGECRSRGAAACAYRVKWS